MTPCTARLLAAALTGLAALPASAQYKVVAPDGSVTYTDRPPVEQNVRVTNIGRNAGAAAIGGDTSLPAELRQVAQRYPVTLYTTTDCPPCDSGRRLLQQRGIPYSERRLTTEEDALALDRLAGGRTVPALTIGAQPLRGFGEADWMAYLDAAGYPRESKLPRNWPVPTPTPLVERAAATPQPAPRPAPAPAPAPADEPPPAPGGIRF
jgi:glutaredoxin